MMQLSPEQRQRLVAAHRARSMPVRRPAAAVRRPAASSDPCVYCGVPGEKGCAHFLPYERPEGRPTEGHGPSERRFGTSKRVHRGRKYGAQLLDEIEAFLERSGMAAYAFGRLALNDPSFVGRLRQGKCGATERTQAKVRAFIARQQQG